MKPLRWVRLGGVSAAVVVLGACSSAGTSTSGGSTAPAPGSASSSGSAPSSASSASSSASSSSSTASGADLGVANTSLGTIVVDAKGRTAYYYDKDKPGSGSSTCVGGCLAAWPAIAPSGSKPTVKGVTAKVGTITRDDGTRQLTVAGRPVYLFVKDTAPGDVKGQGVGGVWYVIAADGSEVTKSATS